MHNHVLPPDGLSGLPAAGPLVDRLGLPDFSPGRVPDQERQAVTAQAQVKRVRCDGQHVPSPPRQYELVVHQARPHYKSLIHYRIDELGQPSFIYEWDPSVNYMQIWCLEGFFAVKFPDGALNRGMYGEPVFPWPIGKPDRTPWWIGRAW